MICKECGSELRNIQTRYSKRLGAITRKKTCKKCGYLINTVEINRETWEKDNKLMTILVKAVGEYNTTENLTTGVQVDE